MPLISENWQHLLEPGQRRIYDDVYGEQGSNIAVLFDVQSSSKAVEHDLSTGDTLDFAPLTSSIPYDEMGEGYETSYTHAEYARGYKIERRLVDDDQYNIIDRRPRLLALAARRRREADGASMFNNAFNSSVTGGDGVCLCSASHPSNNGGAVQSNAGSSTLSPTSVEATRRLMIGYRSDRDGIISVNPDFILAPLALEDTLFEINNSKGKVDTAQNNANFHFGKYRALIWPNYLTSSTKWFMFDSQYMKEFQLWFDRVSPEFFRDREFDTLMAKFAGYMRYSYGWSDWRHVYGHNP